MLDKIQLCKCVFQIDELEGNQIKARVIPRQEFCFACEGTYYNLIDFKKYKLFQDKHFLGEEYIAQVKALDESELEPKSQEYLNHRKELLIKHIDEEKAKADSLEDYIDLLPHAEFVFYEQGTVLFVKDKIAIKPESNNGVALLYNNKYYDLGSGEELKTLSKDINHGDTISYNFKGILPEIISEDEYRQLIISASQIMIKINDEAKPKIIVMR